MSASGICVRQRVKKALRGCGYPKWAFHKAAKKGKKPGTGSDNGRPEKALAKIPNVAGVVKRIKSALKSHFYNNLTTFKPIGTLRSKLVKVKDKMPREKLSNLVYGIPCGSQDVRPPTLVKPSNPFVPSLISIVTRDPTKPRSLRCTYTAKQPVIPLITRTW